MGGSPRGGFARGDGPRRGRVVRRAAGRNGSDADRESAGGGSRASQDGSSPASGVSLFAPGRPISHHTAALWTDARVCGTVRAAANALGGTGGVTAAQPP
jgi:hypothetical protein